LQKTVEERIQEIMDRTEVDNNECLNWLGAYRVRYPFIYFQGKCYRGNRLLYALCFGKIPDGMFVMHTCDNVKCINPNHLRLGTPQDNVDDMISKGRHKFIQKKTHCSRGHEFSPDNITLWRSGDRYIRHCKKCLRNRKQNKARETLKDIGEGGE
jgi:hypothetical protein